MAIQTKQSILIEATQLHQRLIEAQSIIQRCGPEDQSKGAPNLLEDAGTLIRLKNKVSSAYSGAEAIPGADQDDLDEIAATLFAADGIVEAIEKNQDIAEEYVALASETEDVFKKAQTGDLSEQVVKSLKSRVTDLTCNTGINEGNLNAARILLDRLSDLTNLGHSPQTVPQLHRDIIAIQEESRRVGEFKDRFNLLNTIWKNIPHEDFEVALSFYAALKATHQQIKQFRSPENQATFQSLITDVEKLLSMMINRQKETENMAAQANASAAVSGLRIGTAPIVSSNAALLGFQNFLGQTKDPKAIQDFLYKLPPYDKEKVFEAVNGILLSESKIRRANPLTLIGQPFTMWGADVSHLQKAVQKLLVQQTPVQTPVARAIASPALLALKKALEPAKTPGFDPVKLQPTAQTAFGAFTLEEKKQLLEALGKILMEKNERKGLLPAALLNAGINAWPGSCALKLEAVERLVNATTPEPQASVPSTPSAKKLSETMQERFNTARIVLKEHEASPTTPVAAPSEGLAFARLDPKILESIHTLQKTLPLLTSDSIFDLQDAIGIITLLESMGTKALFKISGSNPLSIADRPFFHLYFIHRNELEKQLPNDNAYGTKAFGGEYPTTNEERKRAVLRTLLELVLETMEDAINLGSTEDLRKLNQVLADITPQCDEKDVPMNSLYAFGNTMRSEPNMDMVVSMRGALKHVWNI